METCLAIGAAWADTKTGGRLRCDLRRRWCGARLGGAQGVGSGSGASAEPKGDHAQEHERISRTRFIKGAPSLGCGELLRMPHDLLQRWRDGGFRIRVFLQVTSAQLHAGLILSGRLCCLARALRCDGIRELRLQFIG
jgi:hypothetical protein